jgi:hypothetical protein
MRLLADEAWPGSYRFFEHHELAGLCRPAPMLAQATENDHEAVIRFLKSQGALATVARAEKDE